MSKKKRNKKANSPAVKAEQVTNDIKQCEQADNTGVTDKVENKPKSDNTLTPDKDFPDIEIENSSPEANDNSREAGIEITEIKIISEEHKQELGKIKQVLGEALDENADELTQSDGGITAQVARKISLKQVSSSLFGFFVLVFAIIGIVACSMYITDYIEQENDDSELRAELTALVSPLTAMDASTFESVNTITEDVLLTAACWDIIINPSSGYTVDNGYYTVSYLEIDKRIAMLFGGNLAYTHKTVGDEELLFEYDEDTGMYSIPAHSKMPSYTANIVEYAPTADGYKIKVAYTLPIYEFINSAASADKIMLYTVKSSDTGYTIVSLEMGELIIGIE